MAIINIVPGLEATIKVNGITAAEYENPDPEESHALTHVDFDLPGTTDQALPLVVKYIEAKPGERYEFCVAKKFWFHQRNHHIAYGVSMDGFNLNLRHQPAHNHRARKQEWHASTSGYISGNPTAGYENHLFQFSALDIVETGRLSSGTLEQQMSVARRCGSLRVVFFNMQQSELDNTPMVSTKLNQNVTQLAEKAVKGKAVDCFTSYATEPGPPPPPRPIDAYSDGLRRPFAVFEFRYRTREGLMREGIIPRPGIAEKVQGMSEGELRRRLTQMMEDSKRPANGNTQQDSVDTKDLRGIKREAEEMDDDEFMARYKAQRLDNGRLEVDFTYD